MSSLCALASRRAKLKAHGSCLCNAPRTSSLPPLFSNQRFGNSPTATSQPHARCWTLWDTNAEDNRSCLPVVMRQDEFQASPIERSPDDDFSCASSGHVVVGSGRISLPQGLQPRRRLTQEGGQVKQHLITLEEPVAVRDFNSVTFLTRVVEGYIKSSRQDPHKFHELRIHRVMDGGAMVALHETVTLEVAKSSIRCAQQL